jgi:hypothetical protein
MCEGLYKTVLRTTGQFVPLLVTVPRLLWSTITVLMSWRTTGG